MTGNTWGSIQRATTRTKGSVDINKLRVLIAEHLQVDVRRVTDDAHLSHDLLAIEPAVLENFISEARGLRPITFYKVFACSLSSARYRQLGLNQSRLPSM